MLRLLDRQMIFSYVKAYLICLVSLLGLFIVIDLFMNLDDFTQGGRPMVQVLEHIGKYYGYKSTQIFDRLCEAIVLLAAMFTVAWMQRNNELLPLLSAGVSTRAWCAGAARFLRHAGTLGHQSGVHAPQHRRLPRRTA